MSEPASTPQPAPARDNKSDAVLWDYWQCRIKDSDEKIAKHEAHIQHEQGMLFFYLAQIDVLCLRMADAKKT